MTNTDTDTNKVKVTHIYGKKVTEDSMSPLAIEGLPFVTISVEQYAELFNTTEAVIVSEIHRGLFPEEVYVVDSKFHIFCKGLAPL